jgi:YidC/Oxa1 family membrane protein insertase
LLLLPVIPQIPQASARVAETPAEDGRDPQKYKDDKEAQAKAMMELYSTHKVNPLSSCLPLLIQLPILIALYQVFIQSLNGKPLVGLYNFVPNPGHIDPMFLHWLNLGNHNIYMALVAAVSQYLLGLMQQPKASSDPTAKMMRAQVLYMFPVITLIIGLRIPAGWYCTG